MKNVSGTKNMIPLLLLVLGLVLASILMSLPLYRFTANVYTKKSANTFVGDDTYLEVRSGVEKIAEDFRAQGMAVTINETVTKRTNSKGEETSLVAFSIEETFTKSIWSFLPVSLPSSVVLRIMAACMILSLLCALAGCAGRKTVLPAAGSPEHGSAVSGNPEHGSAASGNAGHGSAAAIRFGRRRKKGGAAKKGGRHQILLSASCLLLLTCLVLVPVFILMNNYLFWRKIGLYNADLLTQGKEALFAQIDSFLFHGNMKEAVDQALGNLSVSHSPLVWLLMACFLVSALAAVRLRFGAVKKTLLRAVLIAFVLVVCVVTLYPYYVMFITAFRSNAETLDMYFLHMLPTKWIWSNLSDIVNRGVPRFLLNSLMIAGGATALAMLCGIPAAFAMARMRFKGKKIFLGFVIMSQMFSPVVLLIGISQLMNLLHLSDSIAGLIFINAAFNQAFAIWLLRGTFVAISPEMEQAARIDGCSTAGSLVRVLLPMAAPGIVTTLIFVFINAWNEYTISTVLISTANKRPITVGITQFSSFNMIEWQYLFAASLLATVPVVILFMAIEKHLTSGLTSGGVKG